MTGRPSIVLWPHAAGSFPRQPEMSRPLGYATVKTLVVQAARDVGDRLF
jgi:hypothetical protein